MTEKSPDVGSERNAKSKGDAGKDARAKNSPAAVKSETSGMRSHSSPKKRRKVNHGKVPWRMRQGSLVFPLLGSHDDLEMTCANASSQQPVSTVAAR